jgi:hypothetical protein
MTMVSDAAALLDLRRRVAFARLLIASYIARSASRTEALQALAEVLEVLSAIEVEPGAGTAGDACCAVHAFYAADAGTASDAGTDA